METASRAPMTGEDGLPERGCARSRGSSTVTGWATATTGSFRVWWAKGCPAADGPRKGAALAAATDCRYARAGGALRWLRPLCAFRVRLVKAGAAAGGSEPREETPVAEGQ